MHKFFLVARNHKLCSPHIVDLDDLRTVPENPRVGLDFLNIISSYAPCTDSVIQILDLAFGTGMGLEYHRTNPAATRRC